MATTRLRGRSIAKMAGLLALLVVFGVLAWQFYLEWRTEAMLAEARERGEPITLAELAAQYPSPPPSENVGAIFAQVPEIHVANEQEKLLPILGNWKLPAPYEAMPPENLAAGQQVLLENARILSLLHEAAELPPSYYPVDFQAGVAGLMKHLRPVHDGGRLLALEALIAAEGDAGGEGFAGGEGVAANDQRAECALRAVFACLSAADRLRMEPFRVSQIVCQDMNAFPCLFLDRIVSRVALADDDLARLIEAILAAEDPQAEWRGLLGERCIALAGFDSGANTSSVFGGRKAQLVRKVTSTFYSVLGFKAADRRAYVELNALLERATLLPYHERIQAEVRVQEWMDNPPGADLTARYTLEPCGDALSFASIAAHMRTAAVGLAVERHRLANGVLPESLEALVPAYLSALPLDPYSGGPFHYVRTERGSMVYSYGLNGVDDGGNEELDSRAVRQLHPRWIWKAPLDVAFRVER